MKCITKKISNKEIDVPDFSFGAKAVIRPLPSKTSGKILSIKTFRDLKKRIKENKDKNG